MRSSLFLCLLVCSGCGEPNGGKARQHSSVEGHATDAGGGSFLTPTVSLTLVPDAELADLERVTLHFSGNYG
ncbi:MAG TPA: hypothetical protein VK524_07065, partial [Polyangiaceae bacterium]|nr:hypothetical protein [Polyangiaceae bacterium]